jgi:hypothetical protein
MLVFPLEMVKDCKEMRASKGAIVEEELSMKSLL